MFYVLICTSCFPTSSCLCSTTGTFSFLTNSDTNPVTVHQQEENNAEFQLFHKPVTTKSILPWPMGFSPELCREQGWAGNTSPASTPESSHTKGSGTCCPRPGPRPWAIFLCSIKTNCVNVTVAVSHLSTDTIKLCPWYLRGHSDITLFWLPMYLEHSLGNSADFRGIPNTHLFHP